METKEKTMPVPDGWEFDRIDDSGNIVLKEKKKELPKTWLKCLKCVNDLELIDTGIVCRNAWWKQLGWKPDWTDRTVYYYCITNYNGIIDMPTYRLQNMILAFPSEDIANQFLDTFRDLIEEAMELL